jgi:small subunit ribosomal protein S6
MKLYETGVIIDSQLEESQINQQIEQLESLINNNGGKIVKIDRWGMRRLAYEIKKRQQGFYVFISYESESVVPQKIEQAFRVNESVLRFMTIVPDGADDGSDEAAAGAESTTSYGTM